MTPSPEQQAGWNDRFACRERNPHYDESLWVGGVRVRVVRIRHQSWWRVAGDLMRAAPCTREEVAAFIRIGCGLPDEPRWHDLVWLMVWHARDDRRGGISSRRRGLTWEGTVDAVNH